MKRRVFLKQGAAAAAAAVALAGAPEGAWAVERSKISGFKWDRVADVVVVGFGGAGGFAALEAHDCGASVLVLEKTAEGGGSTAVSGAGFTVPKDKDDAFDFFKKTYDFVGDEFSPEILRTFCDEIVKAKDYLKGLKEGTEVYMYRRARYTMLPHSDTIEKFGVRNGKKRSGPYLYQMIREAAEKRGIPILFSTPAVRIVTENGTVAGVEAKSKGTPIFVQARKAVVLATGGFENNPKMLKNFVQGDSILNLGTPANTGDGILMAQALGAGLWHMTACSCPLGVKIPGKNVVSNVGIPTSGFWVDRDGRRFCNEKGIDLHAALYAVNRYDTARLRYPAIPAFAIFDRRAMDKGDFAFRVNEGGRSVVFGWAGHRGHFTFSPDGKEELEAGIIRRYSSLEELAKKEGINAARLKETLERWNRDIRAGEDTEFGRKMKTKKGKPMSLPLEGNEFFVMTLYPALLNTQGGPKHNEKSQVLDTQGRVIPRLYAAGELGSMWGSVYEGGTNLGECLVFGRIAGREAAKEKSL